MHNLMWLSNNAEYSTKIYYEGVNKAKILENKKSASMLATKWQY